MTGGERSLPVGAASGQSDARQPAENTVGREEQGQTSVSRDGLSGTLKQTSLTTTEEENAEAVDSAFEEELSDYWLSPGLTRQNSCLEAVPEDSRLSRRASLLDDEFREALARRHSRDSRRGSAIEEMDTRDPLGRRDSLLEAVLAAKRTGWRGLVRTDSVESGASLASVSSMSSDGSGCPCDDCFLGLTDLQLLTQPPAKPKKVSEGVRR
ncbi:uncharacterized protein LOC123514499 [Portunus trituberculatus]|uniref:uncharacterized protein LOC123514499 n=1 Tax=Portunus trituberculatus TaxID=210409 RepID=UPI001E1D02C6|nr:uncharacterized protein LOC123514499 [Portunus trituberculatus]